MTLKYESEILFDLMKRDGDDAPSDVLPYESELKEKYLNQVVGAYPKLQDYRPEWLNYNLYHHLPSDFPVESVTNVTNATFENVVPYAYKSAILKGQTKIMDELGNECESPNIPRVTMGGYINPDNGEMVAGEVSFYTTFLKCPTVSFVIKGDNKYKRVSFYDKNKTFLEGINNKDSTNTPIEIPYSSIPSTAVYMRISASTSASDTYTPNTILLIEDTNGNNLYTTHLESVRMPVLTTSNEDGTKTNILTVNEDVTLRGIEDVKDELDCLTGKITERIDEIVLDGSENWGLNNSQATTTNRFILTGVIKSDMTDTTLSWYMVDKLPKTKWSNSCQLGITLTGGTIFLYNNSIEYKISALKSWLSQNPITVQYELAIPTIKTVDLSCINEQGESETFRPIEGTMHVNTSSQTLPALLDMSVPVEATSQNLMSFANIVEEE